MSIILDALRKSENERRRQERPGFSDLPMVSRQGALPPWVLITLGALGSLVVLLGIGMWQLQLWPSQPGPAEEVATAPAIARQQTPAGTSPAPSVEELDFSEPEPYPDVEPDRSVRPLAREVAPPPRPAAAPAPAPAPTPRPANDSDNAPGLAASGLPSLDELMSRGELTLPDLHMDLHVYATDPTQRFVFINGRRLRHGEETAGGVRVVEILADGVILQQGGTRFVLPRD